KTMGNTLGTEVLLSGSMREDGGAVVGAVDPAGRGACTNTTAAATPLPSGVVTRPETEWAPAAVICKKAKVKRDVARSLCGNTELARRSIAKPIAQLTPCPCRIQEWARETVAACPNVLERDAMAQTELDQICGRERVATLATRGAAVQVMHSE